MKKTITTSLAVLTSAMTSLAFATPAGSFEAKLRIEICRDIGQISASDSVIITRLSSKVEALEKTLNDPNSNMDSNFPDRKSVEDVYHHLNQSLKGMYRLDASDETYTVERFCEGKLYTPAPPKTLDQVVRKMTIQLCSQDMNQSHGAKIVIRAIEEIDVMRGSLRPGHSERIPMDQERDFLSDAYDGLMTSENYTVRQVCEGVPYVAPPVKSKTLSELESEMKGQLCSKGNVERMDAIVIIGNTLAKIDVLRGSFALGHPERTRLDAKRLSLAEALNRLAYEPGYTLDQVCQ